MAKNMQNAAPLGRAWQDYWMLLFNGGTDWKSDLEHLILRRVVFLEFGAPELADTKPLEQLPDWSKGLQINVDDNMVSMGLMDLKPLSCSLFINSMTMEKPGWKDKHPVKAIVELGTESKWALKLWSEDCQNLLPSAAVGVGRAIQDAVHDAIRDGRFVVLGRPSQSPFDKPKPLPPKVFAGPFKLDFFHNTILFSGEPKISSVFLHPIVNNSTNQERSNSFKEADLILVEEMRQLVENEGESIVGAAQKLCSKAERRKGATDDSVIQRLQRRYKRAQSNYTEKKKPRK